jgi:hypothetical protein
MALQNPADMIVALGDWKAAVVLRPRHGRHATSWIHAMSKTSVAAASMRNYSVQTPWLDE